MSGVSVSSEFKALDEAFGIGLGEMEWMTINALKSAFVPFDERLRLINEVVKPRLRAAPRPRGGGHGQRVALMAPRVRVRPASESRPVRRRRLPRGEPRGLRRPAR